MKRWIVFCLAAAALFVLPQGQGVDIGEIEPVELLGIQKKSGCIVIATDTGEFGQGLTVAEAVRDAENTATGKLFLETVDYVLVTEQIKSEIPELMNILRPSARLILVKAPMDLEGAAEYLQTHKPEMTLKDWMTGKRELPKLTMVGERYYLG